MVYSGNPNSSSTDAVRFWLQDTSATPLLSDNEILYLLQVTFDYANSDPLLVAAEACQVIRSKYAGRTTITADGVSISAGDLQQKYADLAESLRTEWRRLSTVGAVPFAGGLPDVPTFAIGMHDNPTGYEVDTDGYPYIDPANLQAGG